MAAKVEIRYHGSSEVHKHETEGEFEFGTDNDGFIGFCYYVDGIRRDVFVGTHFLKTIDVTTEE